MNNKFIEILETIMPLRTFKILILSVGFIGIFEGVELLPIWDLLKTPSVHNIVISFILIIDLSFMCYYYLSDFKHDIWVISIDKTGKEQALPYKVLMDYNKIQKRENRLRYRSFTKEENEIYKYAAGLNRENSNK